MMSITLIDLEFLARSEHKEQLSVYEVIHKDSTLYNAFKESRKIDREEVRAFLDIFEILS
jgi:hypothetical protein